MLFGGNGNQQTQEQEEQIPISVAERRRKVKFNLLSGKMEEDTMEIDVEDIAPTMMDHVCGARQ